MCSYTGTYNRIPALNLSVNCMSGTFKWSRRHHFLRNFMNDNGEIAEIILDYNCTNLTTGEMVQLYIIRYTLLHYFRIANHAWSSNDNMLILL